MKSVVVTGVSTGIGRGAALVLARKGWHVYGSVRKPVDGEALQQELGHAFTPLVFDVEDNDAILAAAGQVRTALAGRTLDGLVNNAGASFPGPLLVQSVETFRKQIEINLVGMFAVTRAFAPLLGADPALAGSKGRIVNISSVGGRIGPPFLGAYSASKHAVEGYSESLRRELQLVGIDVIIVGPGAVATAIWDKAEAYPLDDVAGTIWEAPSKAFADYMIKGGREGLPIEALGEVIATALTVPRPKTRYSVMKGRFLGETLPSLLPRRVVDRLLGGRIGLLPKG